MVSIGRTGKATPFADARAGVRRRLDGRAGHAAQPGPGAAQGRAPRRHRHRAQGRRRHPRGGRPGAVAAPEGPAGSGSSRPSARCAGRRSSALEGESDTFCTNVDCPAQRGRRIEHFASRGAMDIEGFGEQRVAPARPTAGPARTTSATSTRSTATTCWRIEGFGEISVRNLLDAIEASKTAAAAPTCWWASASATSAGRGADVLAEALGHLDAIMEAPRGGAGGDRRASGR